jgi:putative flippase GtrA
MTRWTRFASVGVVGFLVQLVTLYVMTTRLRLPSILSVLLAVEAAILHNFIWHERWTWRDRAGDVSCGAIAERLLRFNATSGAVSLFGNVLFTGILSAAHVPVLVANVIAVGCLTVVNYLAADRIAYALPRTVGTVSASNRARGPNPMPVPRSFFIWFVIVGGMASGPLHAAELTPATVAAWNRYVAAVESRRAEEVRDPARFLSLDFESDATRADSLARLRRGEVLARNVAGGTIDLGAGTIGHWRGQIYVPGISVADTIEYAALHGKAGGHRQEDVLESRVLSRGDDSLQLFLKLQRRAVVAVAYNTEHAVSYERLGVDRAVSRSVSTRIAELRDVGTVSEAEQPVGQDRGLLWRLHSYWRYQTVPGGVIVELESLTLSRDIPWALRALAGPVIDRIARESITRTLTSVRARFSGATTD